ncbi:lipid A biosynthesis protein [Candidatus Nitromaritima sp. SCGC AAA799-A02]|nr:lipid A biosynthesis protein [Candidatus Nitromaritima sp. SCGC AAA799-C22]KMP12631.1 lipid A biosynthesis protein [Candidatus Nitromaritima sp. SCGC AAA799-A02]
MGESINVDITGWVVLGFVGQVFFFMRFLVQWIVSEKRGESTIPLAFWYFSIGGSIILLTYAIHRLDPVFILGQSVGSFIYIRNLILIDRKKKALAGV